MYQVAVDPTAVMGRRVGAWLIDFVIAGVLFLIGFSAVDGYSDIPGNLCDGPDEVVCTEELLGEEGFAMYDEASDTSVFIVTANLWIPVAAFVGYGVVTFVLIEGLAGGSLGKLIVGLRVLTGEGRKAGPGRSLLRFALWIIDAFPYCLPLVGSISGYATTGHRRVGDMAAGTFVVDKKFAGQPLDIPGLTAPAMQAYVPPPGGWAPGGPQAPANPAFPGWDTSPAADPAALAPAALAPAAPATPATPATPVHSTAPQWDAARDTYIQWDEFRVAWLQWDTAANEWRPIEEG